MSAINYGGTAFPVPPGKAVNFGDGWLDADPGMTLRDYFAGQALAGMMAHKDSAKWTRVEVAGDCYAYADAMIAARNQKGGFEL